MQETNQEQEQEQTLEEELEFPPLSPEEQPQPEEETPLPLDKTSQKKKFIIFGVSQKDFSLISRCAKLMRLTKTAFCRNIIILQSEKFEVEALNNS